jgi:hypothetical protein
VPLPDALGARWFFVVKEPFGIDAAEPLLDGRVRLPVLDTLFDEMALRRAPLLYLDLPLDSVRAAMPHKTIPESSQHSLESSSGSAGATSSCSMIPSRPELLRVPSKSYRRRLPEASMI